MTRSRSDARQEREAQVRTATENLIAKTDVNTKRMAGLALAATLTPGLMSLLDGNDDGMLNNALSGAVSLAGVGGGAYLGQRQGSLTPEKLEEFKRQEVANIKNEVRELAKTDPQAAVEMFAKLKDEMIDDISPVDAMRAKSLRMDMLNQSPRQLRGATRGAAIGAAASLIPAYLATRQEEETLR